MSQDGPHYPLVLLKVKGGTLFLSRQAGLGDKDEWRGEVLTQMRLFIEVGLLGIIIKMLCFFRSGSWL